MMKIWLSILMAYALTLPMLEAASPAKPVMVPAAAIDQTEHYPNPGILAFRDGRWIGSDHLYNLPPNIDIDVELYVPEGVSLPITKAQIWSSIAKIFEKARIVPHTRAAEGKPPLPFFHMLIMAHPLDKGFVVFIEGRLFEKVEVERVTLDPTTVIQAITWESQNLIVSSQEHLAEQILKNVDEISHSFAERFRFYEDIRMQIQRR